jgi:hypothetical protein
MLWLDAGERSAILANFDGKAMRRLGGPRSGQRKHDTLKVPSVAQAKP